MIYAVIILSLTTIAALVGCFALHCNLELMRCRMNYYRVRCEGEKVVPLRRAA